MAHVQIEKEDGPMIRRTDWGISHADLMCEPIKVEYDFVKRRGFLYMDDGDCCDMTGCIKRAQELMPDVRAISTINQEGIDTFYYISPGFGEFPDEWRSMNGGPKPPMFQEAPYASENGG
jgi:hypothetical protein